MYIYYASYIYVPKHTQHTHTHTHTQSVLFIGTQFSILYTSMYSPAEAATPCIHPVHTHTHTPVHTQTHTYTHAHTPSIYTHIPPISTYIPCSVPGRLFYILYFIFLFVFFYLAVWLTDNLCRSHRQIANMASPVRRVCQKRPILGVKRDLISSKRD
jgi:hypothetical protein